MRIIGRTVYDAHTNQPLYSYTVSRGPHSDLPDSLISLHNISSGVMCGSTRRGGPSGARNLWGLCGRLSPGVKQDVITVGRSENEAAIQSPSVGSSCWARKPTWVDIRSDEEWAFFEDPGFSGRMVLRDAIVGGKEVMRVESGELLKLVQSGTNLSEEKIGEIILVLISLRFDWEESKRAWYLELLCW